MKSNKDFRGRQDHSRADDLRRGVKLQPAAKSGKGRNNYSDYQDEDEDLMLYKKGKRESVLDYFDDEDEEN